MMTGSCSISSSSKSHDQSPGGHAKADHKMLNELIFERVVGYLKELSLNTKMIVNKHQQHTGIKMGRIPKAEKVKAIEVLRSSDQGALDGDDLDFLDEDDPETSYSKRFEKRRELDKNLKILAENVLKSCGGEAPGSNGSQDEPNLKSSPKTTSSTAATRLANSSRRQQVASIKQQPATPRPVKSTADIKKQLSTSSDDAELMAIIDNLEGAAESPGDSGSDSSRRTVCLDTNEDYMSRFLSLLFEKTEK